MVLRWVASLAVLAPALLAAIAAVAEEAHVSGTATWRERIALPANTVFEAVLEDVSTLDAPAVEVGRVTIEEAGAPPFAFEIPYDPAAIDPGRRYSVRARVTVGERLAFITDEPHPVLTGGAPDAVEIVMTRAAQPPQETPAPGSVIGAHGLRLPASFVGDLPCPDCEALRYELNLWPDQAFHLRRTWVGKDFQQDHIGRWSVDPELRVLTLDDGEQPVAFEIAGPERLRPLAPGEGAPEGKHELVATETFEPVEVHLRLRGTVTYMADAARFTECLTGRDYPLATEGDYAALEHAYLAAGAEPGTPLMASFDGAIVERPSPDGGAAEPAVLVERFIGVWPGDTCERGMTDASLTSTYWKILRLDDTEIAVGEGRREPHLVLHEGDARFNATVGCNALMGSYELDGDRLSFGPAASTMTACPAPLDDWERALGRALGRARTWRVDGPALELFDRDGAPVALFQAVYLPWTGDGAPE